jgi:hypothetical protein
VKFPADVFNPPDASRFPKRSMSKPGASCRGVLLRVDKDILNPPRRHQDAADRIAGQPGLALNIGQNIRDALDKTPSLIASDGTTMMNLRNP